MASDCCHSKANELTLLKERQSKVLWIVLAINTVMFVVELNAGLRSQSLSLTGDSLDMLGDALVYGSSLFVLHKSEKLQAGSAFLKGIIMLVSSLAVFAKVVYQLVAWQVPEVTIMGRIGLLALLSNMLCLLLLSSHKDDNINMGSVWLCSRNDIIANVSVLIAALFVLMFSSPVPDLIVGLLLAVLFAKTALRVLGDSWSAMRSNPS
jgi:Co/Zn/Cd efflux system component